MSAFAGCHRHLLHFADVDFDAWELLRDGLSHLGHQHGAEDRDADHAAALAQEHAGRGGDADLAQRGRALRDHIEQALRGAEADADDEQAPHHIPLLRLSGELRHQVDADKLEDRAGEHDAFVLAGSGHVAARQRG